MSDAKKKVKAYMDEQIAVLEEGLDRLYAEDRQPAKEGNLYNGMLKSTVEFEITHMHHLSEDLQKLL